MVASVAHRALEREMLLVQTGLTWERRMGRFYGPSSCWGFQTIQLIILYRGVAGVGVESGATRFLGWGGGGKTASRAPACADSLGTLTNL